MGTVGEILAIWMSLAALVLIAAISRGVRDVRSAASRKDETATSDSCSPCEILVPVTGTYPEQSEVLATLLTQSHPNYRVIFILEGEDDPANQTVDRLCLSHGNAKKIFSGISMLCGQKNHNLITGIRHLRPESEIVVFCDATNKADPGWLLRFTRPLEADPNGVFTTFRDFHPIPPALGGICQAIYAAFLLLLPRIRPSPWGGATAMHRRTLGSLHVTDAWSRTVVDDVVLGRLLYKNGIRMTLDRWNRLDTPLRNQSVRGFLAYLERQVLFPKFADPAIWLSSMALHLNLTLATLWALVSLLILFPLQVLTAWAGWSASGLLICVIVVGLMLRGANRHRIPAGKWLLALYPCIFLVAYVFLKSIFQREIVWHGRRYLVGRKGIVLCIRSEDGSRVTAHAKR